MSAQMRRAPTEHVVLVAAPERPLDGWRERSLLASSSEGPNRRWNVDPERRNEQMAHRERRSR
jgi:hypothetical protein